MTKTALVCTECGYRAHQWHGRCPECGAWDSFAHVSPAGNGPPAAPPVRLAGVDFASRPRLSTGIGEFDRVLGGGLVAGSLVLVAGEPGVGKSTLMLQAAAGLESQGCKVLLVCGEESVEQVAERAARLGGLGGAMASSATDLPTVAAQIGEAEVAMVDSVQTLRDPSVPGTPGSVSQVRACASALSRAARQTHTAVFLVGHVTKDNQVAGPRALEHLVDAVITFEGDRGHALRILRATKNRFGPTAEVGVFEMGRSGLTEVPDASGLFLKDRRAGAAGSAVGCMLEGRRPVALEVQTLVMRSGASMPRRVASGIDATRLGVVAAVLDRRAQVPLSNYDVYASIAGGVRAAEPGIDLALAVALASSRMNKPPPADAAFIGEVGLGGEVRAVPGIQLRIAEVARLGFKRVITPVSTQPHEGVEVHRVSDLIETLHLFATRREALVP